MQGPQVPLLVLASMRWQSSLGAKVRAAAPAVWLFAIFSFPVSQDRLKVCS